MPASRHLTYVVAVLTIAVRALAQPAAPATYVGGRACAACHARRGRALDRLAPRPGHAAGEAEHGARQLRQRHASSKDGVTSTFFRRDGAYFVRTDGPDGAAARLPHRLHLRRRPAAAVPDRAARAAAIRRSAWPGIRARPPPAGSAGSTSTRTSASTTRDVLHWTGPDAELELHVRRLPFDQPPEELPAGAGPLRDHVVRPRRLLRGLPRPRLAPRRSGPRGARRHAPAPTRCAASPCRCATRRAGAGTFAAGAATAHRTRAAHVAQSRSRPAAAAMRARRRSGATIAPGDALAQTRRLACSTPGSTTPTARSATRSTSTARSCRARCTAPA